MIRFCIFLKVRLIVFSDRIHCRFEGKRGIKDNFKVFVLSRSKTVDMKTVGRVDLGGT